MPTPNSSIVGGSSPPQTREGKQKDVLARLIVETDDDEIKAVLRLYNPSLTQKQLQKALNKAKVAPLVATLKFLGADKDDDDNKSEVVNKLIIRIQALFPDPCSICKNEYVIRRTDAPLLECIRCSQGIHPRCLAAKLGVAEVDLENMTADDVQKTLNPYGLLIYLCGTCHEEYAYDSGPRPAPILPQRLSQVAADTAAEDSEDGARTTRHNAAASNTNNTTSDARRQDQTDSTDNEADDETDEDTESEEESARPDPKKKKRTPGKAKATCSFYQKGTCRYGISGTKCPFSHPQLCRKLMTFGNSGRRGCKKGKECKNLHPKMCPSSLSSRECMNDSCTSYHVKGTRRSNSKPLDSDNNRPYQHDRRQADKPHQQMFDRNASSYSSPSDHTHSANDRNTSNPQAFLEVLNAWTTKFMHDLSQTLKNQLVSQPSAPPVNQPSLLDLNQLLRLNQGAAPANPTYRL